MIRNTALGSIAAAVLLAGCAQQPAMQAAPAAPPRTTVTCVFPWCWNNVVVAPNAAGTPVARLTWDEMKMQKKLSGVTVIWMLKGSPDYEFRSNSVVATGTNAAGASTQFPVRQISPTNFALDDVNTNDLTYTYEVRVFRKGAPPDATPVVTSGTIVNAYN